MASANVVALSDFGPRPGALTAEDFRDVMRELASGVALVTSACDGKRAGCAVSSVASLSLQPPSLLICLSDSSTTLRFIRATGAFTVNILAGHHAPLAMRFSASDVHGEERFAEGEWDPAEHGGPRLHDALGVIECRLEKIVEHATHAIVIGACVGAAKGGAARSLVHWRSRFETLG